MTEITDYNRSGYNYSRYWQKRQYENEAEKIALRKLFPPSGGSLIDLGGGYGRLASVYVKRFSRNILLDYSQHNLDQAQLMIKTTGIDSLETQKGDVYQVPFDDEHFDVALMIRVIHHLEEPQRAVTEAARILKPGGIFILEFASKCHFKARVKAWLRRDREFCRSLEPFIQPAAGGKGIFYNYHPQHVREMLEKAGFKIERKLSVSNLRTPILKRILSLRIMLFLEKITQLLLSPFNFGPSIFLRCRKIE